MAISPVRLIQGTKVYINMTGEIGLEVQHLDSKIR